jgi:hypothetical protein
MAEDTKVVSFPKSKVPKANKTDADHVSNVSKAWRALGRAIADARNFGLDIETDFNVHLTPKISRRYVTKDR